jgi:hypothetical protein
MLLTALIPVIGTVIDKIFPNANEAAQAKLKLFELEQAGQLKELDAQVQLAVGQMEINKVEAASSDPYTSRWRPTIGYVLAIALGFQYILNPLITWGAAIWAPEITPPNIWLDEHLWELISGMLGLAGWRTLDKIKGKV